MENLLVLVQHLLKVFYARCVSQVDSTLLSSCGSLIFVVVKELSISVFELIDLLNDMVLLVVRAIAKQEIAAHTPRIGAISFQ